MVLVAGCWRSGDGVAVDGECGDLAGCWRSGDGVAVDGECGDGAGCWLLEVR